MKRLIHIMLMCLCIGSHAETPKCEIIRELGGISAKPFIGFGAINGTRVNARGKATIFSAVIFKYSKNESVNIVEEINIATPKDGDPRKWMRVQVPADAGVWVHTDFLGEPFKKTTQNANGKPVVFSYAKVKANSLNVRGGAGGQFPILGKLANGATVHLSGRRNEKWAELFAPANTTVYVAAQFVTRKDKEYFTPPVVPSVPTATKPQSLPPETGLLWIGPTPEFYEMFPDLRSK